MGEKGRSATSRPATPDKYTSLPPTLLAKVALLRLPVGKREYLLLVVNDQVEVVRVFGVIKDQPLQGDALPALAQLVGLVPGELPLNVGQGRCLAFRKELQEGGQEGGHLGAQGALLRVLHHAGGPQRVPLAMQEHTVTVAPAQVFVAVGILEELVIALQPLRQGGGPGRQLARLLVLDRTDQHGLDDAPHVAELDVVA